MEKLLNGVVQFKKEDFEAHKELFQELANFQKPHTLFIGCSDSRIVPNMITSTLPGELFVIRNIANIVPPYRIKDEYLATTSAIEYAVIVLEVENIIICGHSNCGGCNALWADSEKLSKTPNVKKWLELFEDVKESVKKVPESENHSAREWITEQQNVLKQMKHLLSYPFIREKYQKNQLNIYGWHYIIETGEVFQFNKETGSFELIK